MRKNTALAFSLLLSSATAEAFPKVVDLFLAPLSFKIAAELDVLRSGLPDDDRIKSVMIKIAQYGHPASKNRSELREREYLSFLRQLNQLLSKERYGQFEEAVLFLGQGPFHNDPELN